MTIRAGRDGMTIALDAMGGANAPRAVVDGAEMARQRHPAARFLLFGEHSRLLPLLERRPALAQVTEIRHTASAVRDEDKPSAALRSGRGTSMRLAIDAVGAGEAQCVVSSGNTGALMAMAKFVLKTLPGIDRPAIASVLPTLRGESVVLDLGANIECEADNLVQFALMGAIFGRAALGLVTPTIGILNVGAEALKGNDAVREAASRLRALPQLPGHFHGFVEGDDVPAGTVDVVVTDGFTGNVALKTAEGTARLYAEWLKLTFKSSLLSRLGYLLARRSFDKLRRRTDPRLYNGAMFLGLDGICVKSHGSTDAVGFAHAIDVGCDLVRHGFNDKVKEEFARLGSMLHSPGPDAPQPGVATA